MKLIGDPVLACDATGRLKSRIGTVFLKTYGIVTTGSMHILQRQIWIDQLNEERIAAGQKPLTEDQADDELEASVDLIFDNYEKIVQIRPDPAEMDMSFLADELLQDQGVSKTKIEYLNIDNIQVRNALMKKGECWRMSQISFDPVKIDRLISSSMVSINNLPLYFYNKNTGTRFLTLKLFTELGSLNDSDFRAQFLEIVENSQKHNYHGRPEIDIFPPGSLFAKDAFKGIQSEGISTSDLRKQYKSLLRQFTVCVPDQLKDENLENLEWRNLLFETITKSRKSTSKREILENISHEFYKQIQWLPGANISEDKELIFDQVFDEAKKNPEDIELAQICDLRAKGLILNYLRQLRNIEYINIGRISRSLSKSRVFNDKQRSNVYIVHFKSSDKSNTSLRIIRFQKWCIFEHLEQNKNLIDAIFEAVNYTDYIFNRRLACTQLGMNLPKKFFTGRIRETYSGNNPVGKGRRIWVVYFERDYVNGVASDKLADKYYERDAFNVKLAKLLGQAAATNIILGRAETKDTAGLSANITALFDDGDEIVLLDKKGLPCDITVSDHTGTFHDYKRELSDSAPDYARFIMHHASKTDAPDKFIENFLSSFKAKFIWTQKEYKKRERAFDRLFIDLPLDSKGSLAHRWNMVLMRLRATDADALTSAIQLHLKLKNRNQPVST